MSYSFLVVTLLSAQVEAITPAVQLSESEQRGLRCGDIAQSMKQRLACIINGRRAAEVHMVTMLNDAKKRSVDFKSSDGGDTAISYWLDEAQSGWLVQAEAECNIAAETSDEAPEPILFQLCMTDAISDRATSLDAMLRSAEGW